MAAAGPGGIAGAEAAARPALRRIDAILCGTAAPVDASCGVARRPTTLAAGREGRPKLAGALDQASTAAQVLLLEYAEGKPAADIGWGRASAADVTRLSSLHALEFALLARPLPLARRNMAGLAPLIRAALVADTGPAVVVIAGHDTNVASLAGLLDVHWRVPGFAPDDPSPGGALVLERLVDRQGRRFVRVSYRSQTLDQIRSLQAGPPRATASTIMRCRGHRDLCPLDRFAKLLE
jgi:4-phytase/acid phosphatase